MSRRFNSRCHTDSLGLFLTVHSSFYRFDSDCVLLERIALFFAPLLSPSPLGAAGEAALEVELLSASPLSSAIAQSASLLARPPGARARFFFFSARAAGPQTPQSAPSWVPIRHTAPQPAHRASALRGASGPPAGARGAALAVATARALADAGGAALAAEERGLGTGSPETCTDPRHALSTAHPLTTLSPAHPLHCKFNSTHLTASSGAAGACSPERRRPAPARPAAPRPRRRTPFGRAPPRPAPRRGRARASRARRRAASARRQRRAASATCRR